MEDEPAPSEPPNKPIKEIRFDIWYQAKHTEEEKKQVRINYNSCLLRHQDKENPHESCEYIEVREEDRIRFEGGHYCYDTKKDKESIFNKNLKARLYDRNGSVLAEDYLRCDRHLDMTKTCHTYTQPSLNFYLPYSKKADKVEVIKIEDGQEVFLKEIRYSKYGSKKKLLNYDEITKSNTYYKGLNCHYIQIVSHSH